VQYSTCNINRVCAVIVPFFTASITIFLQPDLHPQPPSLFTRAAVSREGLLTPNMELQFLAGHALSATGCPSSSSCDSKADSACGTENDSSLLLRIVADCGRTAGSPDSISEPSRSQPCFDCRP
jgi:hypothetical protein